MSSLIHQLVERAATIHPNRPAIISEGSTLTYEQLDAAANRLANTLIDNGVRPGDHVGLYLEKFPEAVTAIYAILKAGAAYVPIDTKAPVTRCAYIASDCGVTHLVTSSKQKPRWEELVAKSHQVETLVVLDAVVEPPSLERCHILTAETVASASSTPPEVRRIDQDLAYILYTSGSTGQPKGVMLSHRNAMAFVDWTVEELNLSPEDRLSSHAPFHFDLSIFDLFAAAAAGASVTLVPTTTSVFPMEVARFIDDNKITVWYSVPSILSLMVQHANLIEGGLPNLRAVVFAGEVFPTKFLSRLMDLLPHAEFHNWYGPTETNVCTAYRVPGPPRTEDGDIPIGRAISNVETAVVNPSGTRVPQGEPGELVVRGATVMAGYWGDADKTAARLVPGLLSGSADPVYRTGDLVVEDPDGNYRFLGRTDHQIKSRGYRIELGEIETALYAHDRVVECAVVAVPDETISNRIRAHIVADDPDLDTTSLVSWCVDRVPRYMVPEEFLFHEQLPKTSTGKIDRQRL